VTRYADDITFSTDRTVFPSGIATVDGAMATAGSDLEKVIESAGFHVNPRRRVLGGVGNNSGLLGLSSTAS
jgi:hypothetical protein